MAAVGAGLRRRKGRVPTDPFDPNAIRAETAAARAAELVARPCVRRADLALTFAPAIATAVDPLLHGRRYFPRILEDIAAAQDRVHLLIYGYKPGDIGTTFLETLSAKVAAGVEVRLAVDAIGSEVDLGSKDLFRQLREAGIEVVAHDGIEGEGPGLPGPHARMGASTRSVIGSGSAYGPASARYAAPSRIDRHRRATGLRATRGSWASDICRRAGFPGARPCRLCSSVPTRTRREA